MAGGIDLVAFDTGPANLMSNSFCHLLTDGELGFDRSAKIAACGVVDDPLYHKMLEHPYLQQPLPKSTGHEQFGLDYCRQLLRFRPNLNLGDYLRTSLKFAAYSIHHSYQQHAPKPPTEVVLSGGGVENPLLMDYIRQWFPAAKTFGQAFKIDPAAKEAVGFALLGWHRILGLKTNLPAITGASSSTSLGKLAFPP